MNTPWCAAFRCILSLLFFMYTFTIVKANVSNYVPFAWDTTFDQWDKTLHFGTRPWEWLQPIFGNLFATVILNVNYNFWFIIMKLFWVYFAFIHAPGFERTRFYLAYMLTWCIGGSLFAVFFSSVGPCFYNYVESGVNPYAELMTQLRAFNEIIPVWAVDTQDMLWQFRVEGSAFGGITAMPSMHNATTLLFVLVTWNKAKWLRNLLIVHMILVFLGSIHLGWHYAVDAYVAWPITLACWYAASKLARWWEQRPSVQDFNPRYTENV